MLQVFYTGAPAPGAAQVDPGRSLGGYVSASPLADDELNNLFGDVTPLGVQYAGPETFALALRNLAALGVTGVRLGYVYPDDCATKLEVAAVALYEDSCGKPTMQPLPSRRSRPQGATFHELEMRRPRALFCVEVGAAAGDELTVLVDNVVLVSAVTPGPLTPEGCAAFLVAQLQGLDAWRAAVPAGLDSYVEVTREQPGLFAGTLELDTDGTAFALTATFQGGLDHSASLGDLAGKDTLGLWLRRTLRPEALEVVPAALLEALPVGNRRDERFELFIDYSETPGI